MRSPSLFSPGKQSRFEKNQGPFVTFHTTTQLNKGQLADFRKEVRNNVSQREPFMPHSEKVNTIFTSWKKPDKKLSETSSLNKLYAGRSSPRKSKLAGGLNMEEIFNRKHIDTQQQNGNFYFHKQQKVESLFKKSPNKSSSNINDSLNNLLKNKKPAQFASRLSGYNDSPSKAQLKIDRFKSWDSKLDVQLKIQNNSIGRKLTPPREQRSYHIYAQQKENYLDKPISTKELFKNGNNFFSRTNTPPLVAKYIEKVPLTDIVRMASHFTSLSSQEIQTISRGYIQELNNLQSALQRVCKQSSGSFGF